MTPRRPVAVFDFDGTLTRTDSVKLLVLALLVTAPWRLRALLSIVLGAWRARAGVRDKKNEIVGCLLRGRTARRRGASVLLYALGTRVFARRSVWRLLHGHVARNDVVIIATASPACAVPPLFRGQPIEVLGTEFATVGDAYTGALASPECRGEEKLRRVTTALRDRGVTGVDVAYSDSRADEPLMRYADRAIWVK